MQSQNALGDKIKAERTLRGWSQADLGRRIGITQAAVFKIENGETVQSKHLPRIALELGFDLQQYLPKLAPSENSPQNLFHGGDKDLPIYASAQGGRGEILRSSDPVDWVLRPMPVANVKDAYGLYVVGESMLPEFRPGEIAIINPHLPTVGGEVYVFYAEQHGEARATIKELRRATGDKWLVTQHNPPKGEPKEFELSRATWKWAHRVVGKFSRP